MEDVRRQAVDEGVEMLHLMVVVLLGVRASMDPYRGAAVASP